jgi:uncharacterized protein (DUF885 family)
LVDITRRSFSGKLPAAALLAIAPPAAALASAPATTFHAIYTEEWAWRQAEFPDQEDADKPIPASLPDESASAQARRLAYWREVRSRLAAIDAAALKSEERVNFAVYSQQIDVLIASQVWRDWEKPLNSDSSFWSDLTALSRRTFRTQADYANYIARLRQYPRYFNDQIENMKAGLARGFTPPRVTLKGRDLSVAAIAEAKSPESSVYYKPFADMPKSFAPAVAESLRRQGVAAITEAVIPAHQTLLNFLRNRYIPGSRTALGADTLPGGRDYYQSKILEFTTLDWSPERIHKYGLAEIADIRSQMRAVMAEVKFGGDLSDFLTYLRRDPKFYVSTPQALLDRAAWIAKTFDGKAGDWFGRLPRRRFAIVPVPDDIAPFYTAGRGGPGVYLVNTYALPSRPLYALTALTLHESAPGHAFQMPLAAENTALPAFRRETYISAFGEGWALYCERLGVEMNMYQTPYDRFGMLSYQAWRAARLVVDTGVHTQDWTRERAVAYLAENTALSDHEIGTEVDRYIAWPGQALAYYLGQMTILAGRAKAETALGANFDIRAFHDTILQLGCVPMPVLTSRIDRFIAEGGLSPFGADG